MQVSRQGIQCGWRTLRRANHRRHGLEISEYVHGSWNFGRVWCSLSSPIPLDSARDCSWRLGEIAKSDPGVRDDSGTEANADFVWRGSSQPISDTRLLYDNLSCWFVRQWGYTTAIPPCTYGNRVTEAQGGAYIARMWLANTLAGVSVSINYDWRDGGTDLTSCEGNFGSVHSTVRHSLIKKSRRITVAAPVATRWMAP